VPTIRVLVADDHPIVRSGIEGFISLERDIVLVGEAADGREAVAAYQRLAPDVVIMDLRMPVMDGVDAITTIMQSDPGARIVALTTYEGDADVVRALRAGARGYLLKDTPRVDVIRAIRSVAGGGKVIPPAVASRLAEYTPRVELTEREVEVLRLVAKGFRNKDIGRLTGCTEGTIKTHLKSILAKLGVEDRTEAVTVALQRGIIHLE
jgi:two-component system, NarL family, response regulator